MGFEGIPIFLQLSDSFSSLISNAGVLAKTILAILAVLSVVSWTIIVEKYRFFRRAARDSASFKKVFDTTRSLGELAGARERFPDSSEAQLISSTWKELGSNELANVAYLDKYLDSEATSLVAEWESYLIFLATTATVSPFLGLLGTVWGIMSSFLSMGVRGSASLYVVGPGIAEALITTIFGLGAAIPAVVGYNYILRVIRRKEDQLGAFSAKFRNRLIERDFSELSESMQSAGTGGVDVRKPLKVTNERDDRDEA
jgi:biopolymer transport protein TolQ